MASDSIQIDVTAAAGWAVGLRDGQVGVAHQVLVDAAAASRPSQRPHDQRLAAARCRRRRRRRARWSCSSRRRLDVAALVELDAEVARSGRRFSGPRKPSASSTRSASSSNSLPATSLISGGRCRPGDPLQADRLRASRRCPSSSPRKLLGAECSSRGRRPPRARSRCAGSSASRARA